MDYSNGGYYGGQQAAHDPYYSGRGGYADSQAYASDSYSYSAARPMANDSYDQFGGTGRGGYSAGASAFAGERIYQNRGSDSLRPPEHCAFLVSPSYFRDYMKAFFPEVYDDEPRLNASYAKYRLQFLKAEAEKFIDTHGKDAWFQDAYGVTALPHLLAPNAALEPIPDIPPLSAEDEEIRAKERTRLIDFHRAALQSFLTKAEAGAYNDVSHDLPELPQEPLPERPNDKATLAENTTETASEAPQSKGINGDTAAGDSTLADASAEANGDSTMADAKSAEAGPAEAAPAIAATTEAKESSIPVETEAQKAAIQSKDRLDAATLMTLKPNYLYINAIPRNLKRRSLEKHCAQIAGFDSLVISPANGRVFTRVGWVIFKPDADMTAAYKLLAGSKIDDVSLHVENSVEYRAKIRLAYSILNRPERIRHDCDQAKLIIDRFEAALKDTRGSEMIKAKVTAAATTESSSSKFELDLMLVYLRTVFFTCYYSATIGSTYEDLMRRSGLVLRRPPGSQDEQEDQYDIRGRRVQDQMTTFANDLDEKMDKLLNGNQVDAVRFGGDSFVNRVEAALGPNVIAEADDKHRCRICQKLFKGLSFVEKHIANKHQEELPSRSQEGEIHMLNRYILDPQRANDGFKASDVRHEQTAWFDELKKMRPENKKRASETMSLAERLDAPLGAGRNGKRRADDMQSSTKRQRSGAAAPLPPPQGASLDPRATKRTRAYHDYDDVASGGVDIDLPY
ncbi:uncharacterized protein L969DRAFT_89524 [Mixia osmundae IAM 14324]|uniref:C2H2-type domain-containing protein n=1 Tax=Mixia osmundae (strain CBS 9802 / IAM 14324 / JCM 22182 / KY 12970) TaxID=764103 RepID=G7DT05_MIXOS|nr:uncharacterized protein L969DRAFT_89524 [Mixia osmundae IAM 14324]KEI37573.1 hypothetical protein L969DRAFT_89524 [Mixia osmundae IAM 14324]GAA93715.1 hypothetical protein E5Q_00361 [Mixia osmundae IAM 14324]